MKKDLYKITIFGWEKYNKKSKPSMPSVMISKRFFDDHKISLLPSGGKLLYLGLLLRRGEVDTTSIKGSVDLDATSFIAPYDLLLRYAGGSGQVVERLLDQLQSFQLLKYEKISPLIKENRKEENRSEKKRISSESKILEGPIVNSTAENREIWECYLNAFRNRYGVDPVRNATVNAQISQLRQRLGKNEAMEVIRFFLKHNDSFYLKKTHSIGLCLKDCETLRTQMLRNTPITQTMVRSFEKSQTMQQTLKEIDEEGL